MNDEPVTDYVPELHDKLLAQGLKPGAWKPRDNGVKVRIWSKQ